MRTVKLKIDGMSCGHCVGQVTAALKAVPGTEVLGVRVGSADVRYDEARTGAPALARAVTSAGYPAVEEGAAAPAAGPATGCGCGCAPR